MNRCDMPSPRQTVCELLPGMGYISIVKHGNRDFPKQM